MSPLILDDVPLYDLNTLHLPANARQYVEVGSVGLLLRLVRDGHLKDKRVVVLGGGSNVVLRGDVDGMVLHMRIQGRELVGEDEDHYVVRAGAGENWHDFVRWTLEHGWGGLENLSLIPGTVGAAPIQNIGAYGVELAECFLGLEAVDLISGRVISFDSASCHFAYRDSVFKHEAAGRFIITAVSFKLPKRWQPNTAYGDVQKELIEQGVTEPTPLQVSDAVVAIRRRKLPDPDKIGNAGSFFKNPVLSAEQYAELHTRFPELPHYPQDDGSMKVAAGWLIEQAGWKGRALGPVAMYERQALVLINRGGATGGDVLRLAEAVREAVREKFGVVLEQEPLVV